MSIAQNLQNIRQIIKESGKKVNLIVVSKTISEEKIAEAINLGCEIFGENKVMEAKNKWDNLRIQHKNIQLHLIGHLQSNKAKEAVQNFDVIQTLDSEKLALALSKEMKKQNKFPELFVQINIGEEEQKSGINPLEAGEFIQKMIKEYGLPITGVMAIPPVDENPALYFVLLNKIAKENNLRNISAGMSGDFETAIDLGANFVRLGSAIFGARKSD
ncbi:MAG: pyridoxal phosphate enzyme (YggS family) [Rickettsiales bacterium]|jgi:pyridoxal phosphate enzyme (YggS family)